MNANPKVASTSRGGTNQSTSQSFIDAYLARRKRDEIDRLMEMLEGWIDSLAVASHALGAGSSSRPGGSSHSGSSTSSRSQKLSGQKRSFRRDSLDDSDAGRDGNDGEKKGNKRPKVGTPGALKLACPFYKCEPGKYRNRQACTGPGWSSISRLKEHIYRVHRQPEYKCKRCCEIFTNEQNLEEHQRADEPCKVSKDTAVDGITESQYHQLRKKPVGNKSPEERWRELYRIIFPKATKIPTSYYDGHVPPECGSEDLEFTNFLENELISEVRNALEERVDELLEEHRNGFLEIVKTSFQRLKMQFFKQHKGLQVDLSQPVMEIPGFPEHDFFSQLDESNFDYNDPFWFDPTIESHNCSSDISDSAYVSLDSPKSPLKG